MVLKSDNWKKQTNIKWFISKNGKVERETKQKSAVGIPSEDLARGVGGPQRTRLTENKKHSTGPEHL